MGSFGERGVFLGVANEGWSLVGVDVNDGRRLFAPLRLGSAEGASDFKCFVNKAPDVLCIRQAADSVAPSTAWVINTETGELRFTGPTELRVAGAQDRPRVEQIGDYAVATVEGKGMYGVGPRGELTWFVPGNGILPAQFATWARDAIPSSLAVQNSGRVADVVFSVADGHVVEPKIEGDVQLGQAVVYPGGFGFEYTTTSDMSERVAFFDDSGHKLSEPEPGGTLETRSLDLPTVGSRLNDRIFAIDGRKLLTLPPSIPSPNARLIGSRLYIATDPDHERWQQFDLQTGEAGKACDGDSLGFSYIASDGQVAVVLGKDTPAQGIDLATCETVWSLPGPTQNEIKEVWKVHTTLLERSGDELFSLVAPT
ncbi:hypothetical protein CIW49_18200 [Mycolicibacterium sp. P1-18]|nr:hypothetical protein CIW49_18200 [Mycolicibacterium sp. P1-18]